MQIRNLATAVLLGLSAAHVAQAATLPGGEYRCMLFIGSPPRATIVGEITIAGERYSVARYGTSGRYSMDGSGRVAWIGKPPMGFEAAALETDAASGRRQIRMYPKAADIGNKWKAALCTLKSGGDAGAAAGAATGAKGSAFKTGDKVTAEFIGVPYPATVVKSERGRALLHYDDPKSKDEWVEATRIKPRNR